MFGPGPRGAAQRLLLTGLVGVCLVTKSPPAGAAPSPVGSFMHKAWLPSDGLPHSRIRALAQDSDGYLWIGTTSGLARFSGERFVVADPVAALGLDQDNVTALTRAPDGRLWIGTFGGVFVHQDGTFVRAGGEETARVNALAAGREGCWAATMRGLYRFSADGARGQPVPGVAGGVTALAIDERGQLWAASSDGDLLHISGGTVTQVLIGSGYRIHTLLVMRDGRLLAGHDQGLSVLNQNPHRLEPWPGSPTGIAVHRLLQDRHGAVWAATPAGLWRTHDGKSQSFGETDGLRDRRVTALFEDSEGSLWVGTATGGLGLWSDRAVLRHGSEIGLPDAAASSVAIAADGSRWVGTVGAGLLRLGPDGPRRFGIADGLPSQTVRVVLLAGDGSLFAGTAEGLVRVQGDTIEAVGPTAGPRPNVTSLHLDPDGVLWVGTATQGLGKVREGRFEWSTPPGLPKAALRAITTGPSGDLWLGTLDRGLWRLDRDRRLSQLDAALGSLDPHVRGLLWHEGVLWIGTTAGLGRFDGSSVTTLDHRHGLFDSPINLLVDERSRRLWMSSHRGIFHTLVADLDAVAIGRRRTLSTISYQSTEGGNGFTPLGGFQPGAHKDSEGKLWFPARDGLVEIDPHHAPLNTVAPPIVIEAVITDGRRQVPRADRPVVVGPGSTTVEIEFAALSFLERKKIRYRYRLDGFDKDWVDTDSPAPARYTRLPPGSFHFRILAANNDGIWNEVGATVALTVKPQIHQTLWFWALMALAAIGLLVFIHRIRVRWLTASYEAVTSERLRVARDLHDTLLQSLQAITMQMDQAGPRWADAPAAAQRALGLARTMAARATEEARHFVTDLRPPPVREEDLALAVRSLGQRLLAATPTALRFEQSGVATAVPAWMKGEVFRIAQEALSNIARHASAQLAVVTLSFETDGLRLTVTDDGRGFDPAIARQGHFGLQGMRERAAKIGADLRVTSGSGQGTTIDLHLSVKTANRGSVL